MRRNLPLPSLLVIVLLVGCGGGSGGDESALLPPAGVHQTVSTAAPIAPIGSPPPGFAGRSSSSGTSVLPRPINVVERATGKANAAASTASISPWNNQTADTCPNGGYNCVVQGQGSWQTSWFFPGAPPPSGPVTWQTQALPSGITSSFNPVTTSTPPFATTETISASTTAAVGLDTIVADPICGSGCGTASAQVYVLCAFTINDCPQLQILDKTQSGPPIVSGSPAPQQTVHMGQNVELLAQVVPKSGTGTYALSNVQWTIARTTNPVSPSGNDIIFNWTTPGSKAVTLSAVLTRSDGQEIAVPQTQALYAVQPPQIRIRDVSQEGSPIVSGTPPPNQTTVIGKKVELKVEVVPSTAPASYAISSAQWTIPGSIVKSYTTSFPDGSPPVKVSASDFQRKQLAFYWIKDAVSQVSVVATLKDPAGDTLTTQPANANYTIQAPTSISIYGQTVNPVTLNNVGVNSVGLNFGVGGMGAAYSGIAWTLNATDAPADGGVGVYAMTQLIRSCQIAKLSSQGTSNLYYPNTATQNQYWLDNDQIYNNQTSNASTGSWQEGDSPSDFTRFDDGTFEQFSDADAFKDYFFFRPGGSASIFVPLGTLTWYWKGVTTQASPGQWSAPRSSFSSNPQGTVSIGSPFPQWSQVYHNGSPIYSQINHSCSL